MKFLIAVLFATIPLFAQENPVIHLVFCWMDSSVNSQGIDSLIVESEQLRQIPGIQSLTVGRPIPSERPIVDDSFSFGITMQFRDQASMNLYLTDPRHTSFVSNRIKPRLAKLLVYDIQGSH